jgi:hypothetical protein
MLANLEQGKLAADPVQRAGCAATIIPRITFDERMRLADQLAATGDVVPARSIDRRPSKPTDSDVERPARAPRQDAASDELTIMN